MDEKRIARPCGLTLTGLFAVSLILSAKFKWNDTVSLGC
jgi:hypothetical protein